MFCCCAASCQATKEECQQDYTKRLLQTYTFAAPRVGDMVLSTYMSKNLAYAAVQVVNTTDVVPFVPFKGDQGALLSWGRNGLELR
jgi:predicted lipase